MSVSLVLAPVPQGPGRASVLCQDEAWLAVRALIMSLSSPMEDVRMSILLLEEISSCVTEPITSEATLARSFARSAVFASAAANFALVSSCSALKRIKSLSMSEQALVEDPAVVPDPAEELGPPCPQLGVAQLLAVAGSLPRLI